MAKKILIADDEEEIIELIRTAFESCGYNIVSVTHGAKLLALIKKEKPDIILLDFMLPGMDGYSLLLQLEQDEFTKGLPVIIMTALPAAKALFEKLEQVKMFLTKPFEVDILLAKVNEILTGRTGDTNERKSS
jgi:two-component system, OmpR family, alkaline phosphatase synthesis response regulator PhoP